MTAIYKSEAGARAVRERTLELLGRWPVPSEPVRVPTREGETFVVACGPVDAPALVLLHGSGANVGRAGSAKSRRGLRTFGSTPST